MRYLLARRLAENLYPKRLQGTMIQYQSSRQIAKQIRVVFPKLQLETCRKHLLPNERMASGACDAAGYGYLSLPVFIRRAPV